MARSQIKARPLDYKIKKQEEKIKKMEQYNKAVKKPHASCTTPETCIAQNRCRKTGKALVNGKVAK